ncbi:MAG: NUDIX hydrolase [Planctomycetaceae bacterium]|jgi:ADP-ribose pyrophosphatase|nr:NUDIX hydrolase [Planctomycetaceae bacterium]
MSEEKLFQSRLFYIEKRFQTGRSGKQLERHVIMHPGAVGILPVLNGSQVILIRQYRVAVNDWLIEIPAGTLEPNEEPIATASRELIEETGYTAGKIEPITTIFSSPGILREELHLFLATDLTPGPTALEDGEDISLMIVPWDEIRRMISDGEIKDAKTLTALMYYILGMRTKS